MSAMGGHQADLIDALRSLTKEIFSQGEKARSVQGLMSAFQPGNIGATIGAQAGPIGGVIGEALGNNFFVNAAMKAGGDFGRDVAAGVAGDFAKYGQSGFSLQSSVMSNALRAGENIPIIGDVIGRAQGPRDEAMQRTTGMFAAAARAGAKFSDEDIERQLSFFQTQGSRAGALENQVRRIATQGESGERLMGQAAAEAGPEFNAMLDKAQSALTTLGEFGTLLANVNTGIGALAVTLGVANAAAGGHK